MLKNKFIFSANRIIRLVKFLLELIIFIFVSLPLYAQQTEPSKTDRDKPNIILINMDDMGHGDVEAYGGIEYQTPHINQLAAEGMRFTNFYAASPACTPSRAALMTGSYPNRVGLPQVLYPNSDIGLNDSEETIASILKKVGYATGIIGKWHLGDAKEFLPLQHGFDYYYGLPYSNDMWPHNYENEPLHASDSGTAVWNTRKDWPRLPLIEGNKPIDYIESIEDQNMLTTWYTEKAVGYIEENKENPFFLYLAHNMVHVPLAVSDKFKGKSNQGLFGDVMMEIDWSVGEVLNALKENDLEDNTLVIFTADNGPWLLFGNHGGSTGGLRGQKGNTWEGGNKEPAIMRWPGVIPEGTVNHKLASNIDLLPTLAKISGAPLPEKKIDGVDIFPLMRGDENANPREHLYFYYYGNSLDAVRKGKWKLVLPHTYNALKEQGKDGHPGINRIDSTGLALYNLRNDPGERYDVKEENPEVIEEIQELVEKAREDLGDGNVNRSGNNRREPGKLNQ